MTNFDAHLIARLCLPTFQRQCQPDQTQNSDSEFCILYLFGPFVCLSIFLLLYFGECSWSAGEAGCRCASGFCLSATITLPQKYHTVIILHHIYKYHIYIQIQIQIPYIQIQMPLCTLHCKYCTM